MFYKMVNDFDNESWTGTGCAHITPARISYHILGGVKYYIEDETIINFASGKKTDWNWVHAPNEDLPTKEDIIELIHMYKNKTDIWISQIDLEATNTKFEWTGQNKLSVVLFLLRHMEYHIGELNLLLHMSNDGNADDNWIKAFDDFRV
ncbi:MAG TPA: hypothetical protein VF810_02540 [Patescibacteria group bacterium]